MKTTDFNERLLIEPIYLDYDFEHCVVRSEPGNGCFVKFEGETEFKAKHGSKLVTEALLGRNEITKEQYDNFK